MTKAFTVPAGMSRFPMILALEPRLMFDGAAVADAADAASSHSADSSSQAAPQSASQAAAPPPTPAAIEVRGADPAHNNGRKEAVVVDTSVAGYKTLEAGLAAGVAIVEIDGGQGGLAQMAAWARGQSGYDAIHILSHGSSGTLTLGTDTLTAASLEQAPVRADLATIGGALAAEGDILLYGCAIGHGEAGRALVSGLASATGADIAASDDATGAAALGGDTTLEVRVGTIADDLDRAVDFSGYSGLLVDLTFNFDSGVVFNDGDKTAIQTDGGSGIGIRVTGQDSKLVNYADSFCTKPTRYNDDGDNLYCGNDAAETKVTVDVVGGYTFDLVSLYLAQENGSAQTVTISNGTDSFDVVINGDTAQLIDLSALGQSSKFQGITSFTITHSTGIFLYVDQISMINISKAPLITSSTTANFAENATGTVYTATASGLGGGGAITLSMGGADAGLFDFNPATGVVTFKTVPNFEAPADGDANNTYTITITASDANGSRSRDVAIIVTNVNEAPVVSSGASASVNENVTGTVYTVTSTDPDAGASATYSISGGADAARFSINPVTGAVSFGTAPNFEAPADANADNVYEITVQVSDGTNTATKAVTITVANVNEAPTISSGNSASVSENVTGTVYTVTSTDPDAGATATYAISGGADAARFSINPATGVVTFNTAPNFEAPADANADNVYEITVQVSDGTNTVTKAVTITVTNVNEAPTITSGDSAAATAVSVNENATGAIYTATSTDPDAGATATYSISGGADAARFVINPVTGALTFSGGAPNFEAPTDANTDNVYEIVVQVSDGTNTATQTVTITVANVNETPVNTVPVAQTLTEDGTLSLSGGALSVTDPDAGDTLTTVLSVGSGTLSVVTGGGATITGNGTGTVQVAGTAAQIQAALATVTYTPPANSFGANYTTLGVVTTDLGGLSDSDSVVITVTAVADTPSITGATTIPATQTTSGLVISRNAADGAEVTHFKITDITGGTLYLADGTTPVAANAFITYAQGQAGLKFTPSGSDNGTFKIQASTSNGDAGLGGSIVTATVAVGFSLDAPTTAEDTPCTVTLTKGGVETHYQITAITGGRLYSDAGHTAEITSGTFIAAPVGATQALYFVPNANFSGAAGFSAQASTSANVAGLFGSVATSAITVTAVADTPTVGSPTIVEDTASGAIAITRNAADGAEVTHYKITAITGGRLYSDAAHTAEIVAGGYVASAGATTNVYFVPNADFSGAAGFSVQAATNDAGTGLGGAVVASGITVSPVADTPTVGSPTIAEDTASGAIAITRNAADGAEVTHYQITGITGGRLYSDAAHTAEIVSGGYVASAGATTNVYFVPNADFYGAAGFSVQAATNVSGSGLGGSVVASTVTVTPVIDTPAVGSPTIAEDTASGAIAITRNAADGAEVTHYKITAITGGRLYSDAARTTEIVAGTFIASGGATTNVYFMPNANFSGSGGFTVQASGAAADGGLAGAAVTSTITVSPVADTPAVASPTIAEDTASGAIAITRNAADGAEVTHYRITGISGGRLYGDAAHTAEILSGGYVASGGATTNVYFVPEANFHGAAGFSVQGATNIAGSGLGGSVVASTVTVTPVIDTPSVTSPTLDERTTSTVVTITRGPGDGAEVTHYKITAITDGRLYTDAACTNEIVAGTFIASGGATTNVYFVPTPGRIGSGGFTVQASGAAADGGLAGAAVTSTVTVEARAETPTVTSPTIAEDGAATAVTITRNAADGAEVTHYRITGISGGRLYADAARTLEILSGGYVASGGATTNVYFVPNAEFSGTAGFSVQGATNIAGSGLGGSVVASTITVFPVADTPTVTSPTISGTSGEITISRNPVDGAETAYYRITGITGGRLYVDAARTIEILSGGYVASGGATTNVHFVPNADFSGTAGFAVQAAVNVSGSGLGGAVVASTITVPSKSSGGVSSQTSEPVTTALPPPPPPPPPPPSPAEDRGTTVVTPPVVLSPLGEAGIVTVIRPAQETGTGGTIGSGRTLGGGLAGSGGMLGGGLAGGTSGLGGGEGGGGRGFGRTVSSSGEGLTAPSSSGFQVVVVSRSPGGGDALMVNVPIPDRTVALGGRISLSLSPDNFAHTRGDAVVSLMAVRVNGAALPAWLTFNPTNGTFEGQPPPGFRGEVAVRVVARDNAGNEVAQTFKITVGEPVPAPDQRGEAQPRPASRLGLVEQLRRLDRDGRVAGQKALFGALTSGRRNV